MNDPLQSGAPPLFTPPPPPPPVNKIERDFERDAEQAIARLSQSERGQFAMNAMLNMLDDGVISLDIQNQRALVALLMAAFVRPGTTLDAMRDALAEGGVR